MLILFDYGTPKGLIRALSGHTVHTAQAKGWDRLSNGALLKAADDAGFEILLTTDRRIRHLPILEQGRLAGLISIGDVVKAQHDSLALENHYLKNYIQS